MLDFLFDVQILYLNFMKYTTHALSLYAYWTITSLNENTAYISLASVPWS